MISLLALALFAVAIGLGWRMFSGGTRTRLSSSTSIAKQSSNNLPTVPALATHSNGRLRGRNASHLSGNTLNSAAAIPATIPQSALAKIKLPRGLGFAHIPWINDPSHPKPEYVALAQPWYEPNLELRRHGHIAAGFAGGGTARNTAARQSRASSPGVGHPFHNQTPAGTVQISTNFSNAVPIQAREISPTHYALTFTGQQIRLYGGKCLFWFIFKAQGLKGKTVRFDLTNVNIKFWQTLNPVYSYCKNFSSLRAMASKPVVDGKTTQAFNGAVLPDTTGQRWHYIANTWRSGNELCFVQSFTHNHAFIAMRYPYSPAYNEHFLASLKGNPYCKVVTVGKSQHGRPLQVVEIPRPAAGKNKSKPGILIYARENGDEIDGSWPAQGAIMFLLSHSAQAAALRAKYQFLIIPILDPDGAALCIHHNAAQSFAGLPTIESSEYADYFQHWINAGHRLDIALNLHCLESDDGPDVSCPAVTADAALKPVATAIVRGITNALSAQGYSTYAQPWFHGSLPNRLAHWLNKYYGTVVTAFEINSQDAQQHLTLRQLRRIGYVMVIRATDFLASPAGLKWDGHLKGVLARRSALWRRYGKYLAGRGALTSEPAVRYLAKHPPVVQANEMDRSGAGE